MADNAHIRGFRYSTSKSSIPQPKPERWRVASAYQGQIGGATSIDLSPGDPVNILATGMVQHAQPGATIYGIVVGIAPYYQNGVMTFGPTLPGATTYGSVLERQSYVYVCPVGAYGSGIKWEIDCDDAATATTEAAYIALIGENADHVFLTGSEPSSNCMLDISDHKTATAQWRIQDISQTRVNQDFSGNYVKLIVEAFEVQSAGI